MQRTNSKAWKGLLACGLGSIAGCGAFEQQAEQALRAAAIAVVQQAANEAIGRLDGPDAPPEPAPQTETTESDL